MARGIREGCWTSEQLVEAHIEQIIRVNPVLQAIAIPLFEEARQAARAADLQVAEGSTELGALHGVPVTIKESLDVVGTPSTWGLPHRQGRLAQEDDPAVARLRQSGAIVIGKSNIMQLLMGCESVNPVYGRVRNPWRPEERSAGGSSGGEAAIIAWISAGGSSGIERTLGGDMMTRQLAGVHRSFGLTRSKRRLLSAMLRLLGQRAVGQHILPFLGARSEGERHELALRRADYQRRFLLEMERQQVDVLIAPPFLTPAVQHDQSVLMSWEGSYALLYNFLRMPAGVVSTSRVRARESRLPHPPSRDRSVQAAGRVNVESAGLPVGVQVAAPPWREDLVLLVMTCLEEQFRQTEEYPVGKAAAWHPGN
jgi:Asp-tRNA(Asn)/Glu-tRNA(Gln) amidotransferase A subunit family amidase